MSLYYVQKLLYQLNRDSHIRQRFDQDRDGLLSEFDLTEDEMEAVKKPDIGLLYVLGVNGQILMHYAALHNIPWDAYLQQMRDGLEKYGPVRAGVYFATGYKGVDAHDAALKSRRKPKGS